VHAKKVQWQVLQQRLHTAVCAANLMTAATICPPSRVSYTSNEIARAFKEREIEGTCMTKACMHHAQFRCSLCLKVKLHF